MRKANIIFLIFITTALSGCGFFSNDYVNRDFDFAVTLAKGYEQKLIKINGTDMGIELKSKEGYITVQAMATGTDYEEMSFEKYVRIAASVDIQNYEKLISIKKILSETGVEGYKTFWEYIETVGPEEWRQGARPEKKIVGPIYYFPVKEPKKLVNQPIKAIMISCYVLSGQVDSPLVNETRNIAKTFRYVKKFW